jgi:GH25 family lysozyme M1 (1,4-beta-N-acetylmuramidase)
MVRYQAERDIVAAMLDRMLEMVGLSAAHLPPGVDVASYQGTPGQWAGEAGKISWAAVKFTELQPPASAPVPYVNPDAAADWAYLKQHKLGRMAYLFAHPSVSVAATVDLFASEADKLGLVDEDAIALDLEVTDGLRPAGVDAWSAELLATLEKKYQRTPVLYTYISFAEAGNCAHLAKYPLWISNPSRPAGKPQVPAPWTTWAMHQYSTTSGEIDRDVANYPSLTAMQAALGKAKGPDMQNLGGSIVAALSSARWPDGTTMVAGLGKDGYVQARRFVHGAWNPWHNVSLTKARGAPGLLAWDTNQGQLFYTDDAGNVIMLVTTDTGKTWA